MASAAGELSWKFDIVKTRRRCPYRAARRRKVYAMI
jgi:hypothetical protein